MENKTQAIVDEMKDEIASVLSQTQGQDAPRVEIIEFLNDNVSYTEDRFTVAVLIGDA